MQVKAEISGSHGGEYKNGSLLEHSAECPDNGGITHF
jgi:hypothetical protein